MSRREREPDHLDAWGAYFSPRRPLIQWACRLSDGEAIAVMRSLGLLSPPEPHTDGPPEGPTLFDGVMITDKTPAATTGVTNTEAM